jgi:hypothetical protein
MLLPNNRFEADAVRQHGCFAVLFATRAAQPERYVSRVNHGK